LEGQDDLHKCLTLRGKTWDVNSYSYNTDPDPVSVPVSFITFQTVLNSKAYVLPIRKKSKNEKEAFLRHGSGPDPATQLNRDLFRNPRQKPLFS
jgi:hypothetical protein